MSLETVNSSNNTNPEINITEIWWKSFNKDHEHKQVIFAAIHKVDAEALAFEITVIPEDTEEGFLSLAEKLAKKKFLVVGMIGTPNQAHAKTAEGRIVCSTMMPEVENDPKIPDAIKFILSEAVESIADDFEKKMTPLTPEVLRTMDS